MSLQVRYRIPAQPEWDTVIYGSETKCPWVRYSYLCTKSKTPKTPKKTQTFL